jgi:hypothetical protein
MLFNAVAAGDTPNVTLLALWDGRADDTPGAIANIVQRVRTRGGRTVIIDTPSLGRMPDSAESK